MHLDRRSVISRFISIYFIIWALAGPIDQSSITFRQEFVTTYSPSLLVFFLLRAGLVGISVFTFVKPGLMALSLLQFMFGAMYLYLGVISEALWNYNTHVLLISLLCLITGCKSYGRQQADDDLVSGISLLFGLVYFQAGLSKIVYSGAEWMNSGLSIFVHLEDFNPNLSAILGGHKWLFQSAGYMTVLGELILGLLFILPRTTIWAASLAFLFHLLVWVSFGISFWHLWIFFPAVYLKSSHFKHFLRFRFLSSFRV